MALASYITAEQLISALRRAQVVTPRLNHLDRRDAIRFDSILTRHPA